jgi:hypothetical protein
MCDRNVWCLIILGYFSFACVYILPAITIICLFGAEWSYVGDLRKKGWKARRDWPHRSDTEFTGTFVDYKSYDKLPIWDGAAARVSS